MSECLDKLATGPIIYTDTIRGQQTHRDDLWAVSTDELNAVHSLRERLARLEWAAKEVLAVGGNDFERFPLPQYMRRPFDTLAQVIADAARLPGPCLAKEHADPDGASGHDAAGIRPRFL